MSRAIDADALMKAMYHRAFETDGDTMWQSGCWVRYRAIEQVVKEQPTIEPERKTGRWIFIRPTKEDRLYVACDQCGQVEAWDENCGMLCALFGEKYAHYCPNCGAYMGGDT